MEKNGIVDDDILLLENELILNTESGGESAIEFEKDVLLLTNALAPEPVVKKIDVGPRISRLEVQGARAENDRRKATGWNIVHLPKQESDPVTGPSRPSAQPVKSQNAPNPNVAADAVLPQSSKAGTTDLTQLLAEARAFANDYGVMNLRTRQALYAALGRTYDITFYAGDQPYTYARLIEEAGLTAQDRAPYTPIIKLVFGPDYDRTRIAEFAAAIGYGRRKNLPVGSFPGFLESFDGGLKAVVGLERLMRKGDDDGHPVITPIEARPAIARKLRSISPQHWTNLPSQGDEFTLVMARRLPDGSVAMVGEVPRDIAMLEKAARKLLANLGRTDEDNAASQGNYTEEV